eukprot:CAMPEP_0172625618 /NCGR_PEP_ID=MMETSP1068-20121228/144882_1 /TAXON_ID=35684 /ORGANISM="Pseudopedinella elastica, Strain CCMP716" /LENGTH=363 /DNA_ID=CAMNT_0013434965 /DNA_START=45 /DNA_END=1136 /DNA_ORIENTATION=+
MRRVVTLACLLTGAASMRPVEERPRLSATAHPSCEATTRVPQGGGRREQLPKLTYAENMIAGGLSRAAAQAICHPLNVCKTLLQATGAGTVSSFPALVRLVSRDPGVLGRGLIEQTVCSVPNGAVNFASLEAARSFLHAVSPAHLTARAGFAFNLASSAVGTVLSSVISVPQTVLLDRTMAGQYPNFFVGARRLVREEGMRGFYRGWAPTMGSKIPSYALTWMGFESLKGFHARFTGRSETTVLENFVLGALAAATTVCVMIPMDTVKTRLTTQTATLSGGGVKYRGIVQCFRTIVAEEGVGALYRALPPRLVSVVPMMGIQLCVYEATKRALVNRQVALQAAADERGELAAELRAGVEAANI